MAFIEPRKIPCPDCKSGQVLNNVTDNYSTCKTCNGEPMVVVCDDYVPTSKIFRNSPCYTCGIREEHHIHVVVA